MNKKVILLILDGWGWGPADKFNAIDNAITPNIDDLVSQYPHTMLLADGEHVGLPKGQMGTSEVNHMAIGLGRILKQDLPKIEDAIADGSFATNSALIKLLNHVKNNNSALHMIGILSDGGVHSHISHLLYILDLLREKNFDKPVYFHLFTDGRDVAPQSALKYLRILQDKIDQTGIGEIATIQGRVFLDRDRDWGKTEIAFSLISDHKGKKMPNWKSAIDEGYQEFDNDQYHHQYYFDDQGKLKPQDGVLFFDYRTDRNFQIIKRTLDQNIKDLKICVFVSPHSDFDVLEMFPREEKHNGLSEILSKAGKNQFHLTETEKYPHLTYFFNGEREVEFDREVWQLLQSNHYVKPLYNYEPTMRAFDITKIILNKIKEGQNDFIVVNYPNTDMVGHTGNYEAAVIAAESVDYCIGKIYKEIKNRLDEYVLIITADHGNSDQMWDYEADQPHTQHTLNPVPFIVVTDLNVELNSRDQLLSNIAPTILKLIGIPKPQEMTGESFI